MVTSHRVTSDDRLRLLRVVTERLAQDLHTDPPSITVRDASDEPYAAAARELWQATGLPVTYVSVDEPQLASFREVAATSAEPYLAIQFDDTITVGMSPGYLLAACRFLQRWQGSVDLVCPLWSLATRVDPERQVVGVVSYQHRNGKYRFKGSRPRRPVTTETIDDLRFGIFENPSYGFFFNHMVVPRADYARRVEWYASNIDARSVHAVELAAAQGVVGPTWRHAAVCLDGVALLDLDYAHTSAAVRTEDPTLRQLVDCLDAGWAFEVVSD